MLPPALAIDQDALGRLCREYDLTLALLFGSRATGRLHPESDLDLGVWRRRGPAPAARILDLAGDLAALLPPGLGELDLADLNRASGLLKHVAAEQGRVLFEAAPGDFAHFRVLAWNLYQDERLAIRRYDAEAIRIALRSLAS